MVNKQLQRLHKENINLIKIRNRLVKDLENVNKTLNKFLNCFASALLKKQLKCERCGYEWNPRKEEIRQCPKCKSSWWDKKK